MTGQYNNKKNDRKSMVFINEKIYSNMVHVVDDGNGNDIGTISKYEALSLAKSAGLDLMQISYNHGESICKICDYGKFQYLQKQKLKQAKKNARAQVQDLKEVCFTIRIDDGDKNTKINHIKKFLEENCKVKLTVRFSRREMNMLDFGKDLLRSVVSNLQGLYEFDQMPKAENRVLSCVIKPIKKA